MTAQVFQGNIGLPIERIAELLERFPGATFRRYGGVLRIGGGDPLGRGGQIVATLSDTPAFDPAQVAEALNSVRGASELATMFSGVSAVASVLNLGVSVAGFASMNRKLGRLSSELHDLRLLSIQRFDSLGRSIEAVHDRLLDLALLTGEVRGELAALRDETDELGRLLDLDRLVKLSTVLERLERGDYAGNTQLAESAHNELIGLRHFFERAIAEQPVLGPRMVRDLGYFQAWAMTCVVETRLLRVCGKHATAREVLAQNVERVLACERSYIRALLGPCPADFVAPGMEDVVPSDAFVAWMEHLEDEATEPGEVLRRVFAQREDFLGERGLSASQYLASLNRDAIQRRAVAIARLHETTARLDSYRLELELCERGALPVETLEHRKLDGDSPSGLYFTAVA